MCFAFPSSASIASSSGQGDRLAPDARGLVPTFHMSPKTGLIVPPWERPGLDTDGMRGGPKSVEMGSGQTSVGPAGSVKIVA